MYKPAGMGIYIFMYAGDQCNGTNQTVPNIRTKKVIGWLA